MDNYDFSNDIDYLEDNLELLNYEPISSDEDLSSNYYQTAINIVRRKNFFNFKGINICFSADVWDFSLLNKTSIPNSDYKLKFDGVNPSFANDIKCYAYIYITDIGKISSARKRIEHICEFALWLDDNGNADFSNVSTEDVEGYLLSLNSKNAHSTILAKKASLQIFFSIAQLYFNYKYNKDIFDILKSNRMLDKAFTEEHKTSDIPDSFFSPYIRACIKIANDESESIPVRATAAMIIVLSQTGIRLSELLMLKVDCLDYIYSDKYGKELCFLRYSMTKIVRKELITTEATTYVNHYTYIYVSLLIELLKPFRDSVNSEYLFCIYRSKKTNRNLRLPMSTSNFSDYVEKLSSSIDKYMSIYDYDNPEWKDVHKKTNNKGRKYYCPSSQQYRTHLCTEMYRKGISLEFVRKFMNHLSEQMEGYHVMCKKSVQEDMDFSRKILYEMAIKNNVALGGAGNINEQIHKFIKENNFNIYKDEEAIISSLAGKMPIRQKNGGVCIKGSFLRECYNDAKTDEFYCAYGVCPNLHFFFFNIDSAYEECLRINNRIDYNIKNGFLKQSQKEIHKMSIILNSKLVPEYEELLRVIEKRGKEELKRDYPQISVYLDNPKMIGDKIAEWKKIYDMKSNEN